MTDRPRIISHSLTLVGIFTILFSLGLATPVLADSSPGTSSVQDLQQAFRTIAKTVLPSVVEIVTTSVQPTQDVPDLQFFFGPKGKVVPPSPKKSPKSQGLGSGVMVRQQDAKVFALTNNHVVDKAQTIEVKLSNGRSYQAKVVGVDQRRDLALVTFTLGAKDAPVVLAKLGDSDQLEVGDLVLAIGHPLGLDFTMTHGIISALGRHGGPDDAINIDSYIQTDAPINQGNSGGALVNLKGEVIGINTWIATPNGANVGLGFAIPINSAKRPIDDFLARGSVRYGWLGALVTNVSSDQAKELGLPSTEGAFIPSIYRYSPAEKAGIQPGDFVTAIDGKAVKNTNTLVQIVGDLPVGKGVDFQIVRLGQKVSKTVVIQERAKESEITKLKLWPGLSVVDLTPEVRDQLDAGSVQGVAVSAVEPKSTADIAGIQPQDIVTKINDQPVKNVGDFYRLFNAKPGETKINFVREGEELSIGMGR